MDARDAATRATRVAILIMAKEYPAFGGIPLMEASGLIRSVLINAAELAAWKEETNGNDRDESEEGTGNFPGGLDRSR